MRRSTRSPIPIRPVESIPSLMELVKDEKSAQELKKTNKNNNNNNNERVVNSSSSSTSSTSSTNKRKTISGAGNRTPQLYINNTDTEESQTSSSGETNDSLNGRLAPATSAILYPPLYGRPRPSPSPDLFATLLHPLLALSRPPSPSPSSTNLPSMIETPTSPNDRSSSSLPAHFPPRKSSDPGPTVESQGFVLYLGSLVAWIGFLIWGLGSDDWLEGIGIKWYPSREWALLFPAWTIMLAFFVYFSYIALNIFITPNLDSLHTLTDTQAYILSPPDYSIKNQSHPLLVNSILLPLDAVPVLHDLPIGLVNRVVMGDFRRKNVR